MPPPKLRPRGKNTGKLTSKKKKKTSPSKLSLSQTLAANENEPPTDTLVAHHSFPASKRRKMNNPYLTIPIPKSQSSSTNIQSILLDIKHYNATTTPDNQSILASSSLPHTPKHEGLICTVLEDFVQCLSLYKNNKWQKLLTYIPFDGPGTYETAPRILIALGGLKDNDKLQLANYSIIDWMAATKKKEKKPNRGRPKGKGKGKGNGNGNGKNCAKKTKTEEKYEDCEIKDDEVVDCPWYQPSTQNQRLRTFFGTVQRVFNWQLQQSDFNFNSGLNGFIKELYATREKEFGKVRLKRNIVNILIIANVSNLNVFFLF